MSLIEEAATTAAKPALPWLIIGALVLLLLVGGGGYYQGWQMRGDHEAAAQLKARKDWAKAMEKELARGDKLARELEAEKRNIKTVTFEVVREIPKVTTVYVEKPGDAPIPIPDAVYTRGFVRLWNNALMPAAASSEPADPAGGADIVRAEVTSADLLENQAINAGQYAECRAQLNRLIDYHAGQSPPPD